MVYINYARIFSKCILSCFTFLMSRYKCSLYCNSLLTGRSGDQIPVRGGFSAPVQTGPGAHQASYTNCNGSFPEVKRPGSDVNHPASVIKRRGERKGRAILLRLLCAFMAGYRVNLTFTVGFV